jgi:hypothetical protein
MLGEHSSSILLASGIALAAFFLMRGAWRRKAGAGRAADSQADVPSRAGTPAAAPPELTRWQVEMHETARDLKAELDSKLAALQTLVALARQERALLERTIASARERDIEAAGGTLAAIESLGDPAALEDSQRLAEVASQIPLLPGEVSADLFERDRTSLAIGRLADRGLAPQVIAEELGLPIGEVELMLSLRAG